MVLMIRQLIITTCALCVLTTPLSVFAAKNQAEQPWHKRVFTKNAPTSNQPQDIWEHIQDNLDINTHANKPQVKTQYNWYAKNTTYLTRTLNRAEPYLYHIVSELEAKDLPLALVILPLVESDYNPRARSSQGAAGLWQLMPATARHLGVKRNNFYDGRHDLHDSTRAAINHLVYLNRYFDGDWPLTLAAYNAGEGTVRKAIKKNQREGKKTDFWSLSLPRETRLYVPKILALAEAISNPTRMNLQLPFIPHAPMYAWVEVKQPVDLKQAATLADMSWSDFKSINSAYNQSTRLPDGTHRLFLPKENANLFRASLAKLDNNDYTQDYKTLNIAGLNYEQQKTQYSVRNGDSLWRIAQANNVSINDLRQWNGLSGNGGLRPGQKLTLYKTHPKTTIAFDDGAQLRKISYRVRRGDSFSKLAMQFKVKQAELKNWNALSDKHMLKAGENLIVYVDTNKSV